VWLPAVLQALGLPDWVLEVLTGRLAPVEVPGVVVHEPRGRSNEGGRSGGGRRTGAPARGW